MRGGKAIPIDIKPIKSKLSLTVLLVTILAQNCMQRYKSDFFFLFFTLVTLFSDQPLSTIEN